MALNYKINTASREQIYSHLKECDKNFIPPLSSRVDLLNYSSKLFEKSLSFEAWDENVLVGMINVYLNDADGQICFITNVSTLKEYMRKGIASTLLDMCLENSRKHNFSRVMLEVSQENGPGIKLYSMVGFKTLKESGDNLIMVYEVT